MGSTEPVNNDHCPTTGGSTCGLVGSLFPRSCRGRAEAFARRLHRRLTSLNGEDIDSEIDNLEKPNESSWLQSNHHQETASSPRVLDHQPRHSPESDLYYDFDASQEADDPGSPAEVVTAAELATLLVNHSERLKTNHHDACHCASVIRPADETNQELNYVYSSPTESNTGSESEAYYDPESSETDKTKTDDFYDPITSDTDQSSQLHNGDDQNPHMPIGRRRAEMNGLKDEDTSEESSLSQHNQEKNETRALRANSSEESLNGVVSSLETTSLSHESLWSTFDDSTVSLQDDITSIAVLPQETRFLKSHSDSELMPGIVRATSLQPEVLSSDEVDFAKGSMHSEPEVSCNGDGIKKDPLKIEDSTDNQSNYSSTFELPGALEVECPSQWTPSAEGTLKNEVNLRVTDNGDTNPADDVSRLLKKLSSSPRQSLDEPEDADSDAEHDEEERPQGLRRCSSLKTGKTPPGTPGRKKIVRFADVLGLDLADVRTYLDEIPKVPNSAYSDLIYDDIFQKDSSPGLYGSSPTSGDGTSGVLTGLQGIPKPDRMLVPMFQQPGGSVNFIDLVSERQVCLENVIVVDPITFCLQGTVRVRNLDFHKSVHIRYTMDSWRTFSDLQALYVNGSCDGFSDKFTFILYCHTLRIGEILEFAIRFQCKGLQYWDNNSGSNYCFQCLPMTSVGNYVPITLRTSRNNHDWNSAFY